MAIFPTHARQYFKMSFFEWSEINDYLNTSGCLMLALRNALDDPSQEACGKCENCIAEPVLTKVFNQEIGIRAGHHSVTIPFNESDTRILSEHPVDHIIDKFLHFGVC